MSNKIQNRIDEALYTFYLHADKETISAELKENIEDIARYNKKKRQILFMVKAKSNKKRNEYLLQLSSKFQEAITANIEKPVSILKQLIQSERPSFALYRNLDKLSKEDIIDIIKDKNLVELLEQLENGSTGD